MLDQITSNLIFVVARDALELNSPAHSGEQVLRKEAPLVLLCSVWGQNASAVKLRGIIYCGCQ